MSIKKRAICMQKVSLGGEVFRCSKCGHMSVISKDASHNCPLCESIMNPVSENSQIDSSVDSAKTSVDLSVDTANQSAV